MEAVTTSPHSSAVLWVAAVPRPLLCWPASLPAGDLVQPQPRSDVLQSVVFARLGIDRRPRNERTGCAASVRLLPCSQRAGAKLDDERPCGRCCWRRLLKITRTAECSVLRFYDYVRVCSSS